MDVSLPDLREAAIQFAEIGGKSTLNHFKKSFQLEFKPDHSPVTNADRESETLIREQIRKHFPAHGIIGEEFGAENENSDVVWILDPIDGTKSFIHGIPLYTTLIGILVKGDPQIGVIYAPALSEMVSAAKGYGCELNGQPCSVRDCPELNEATFLTTEVTGFDGHNSSKTILELMNQTRIHRTWGDAYGHLMVATGRADIMYDPILNIWDAAALLPVVTEAGGVFTDTTGKKTIESGNGISTNSALISKILPFF